MFAEKVKIFVKKVCLQLSGTCSFYEVYPRLKTNTTWIKNNSNNKNNNNKNDITTTDQRLELMGYTQHC